MGRMKKKDKIKTTAILVRITKGDVNVLDAVAETLGQSRSSIIRLAIHNYLEKYLGKAYDKTKRSRGGN